jgi:hypothetical protein
VIQENIYRLNSGRRLAAMAIAFAMSDFGPGGAVLRPAVLGEIFCRAARRVSGGFPQPLVSVAYVQVTGAFKNMGRRQRCNRSCMAYLSEGRVEYLAFNGPSTRRRCTA